MDNSNLIQFPKSGRKQAATAKPANDPGEIHEEPGQGAAARFGRGALTALRYAVFLVLMWMRGIVVGLCAMASVFFLIGLGLSWIVWPDKTHILWSCGLLSFGSFVVMWGYDALLMRLSPQPMMTTL